MMKLYKGMINMHGHALDVQCVDNELNNLQLILLICISRKVQIYDDVLWCVLTVIFSFCTRRRCLLFL